MAWTTVYDRGSSSSKTPSTTLDHVFTLTGIARGYAGQIGDMMIACIAMDNIQTTDGADGTDIVSVSDDLGNTYVNAKTYTNSNGAAAGGATCAIYYCILTSELPFAGGTLTATFNGTVDAKAVWLGMVDVPPSGTVGIVGTATADGDAVDPAPVTISGLDGLHSVLFIHAVAHEGVIGDGYTEDADYTSITAAATAGSPAGSNMGIFGGWRFLTGTTDTVDVSFTTVHDHAQVFVAFQDPGFDVALRDNGSGDFDINLAAAAETITLDKWWREMSTPYPNKVEIVPY